MTESAVPGSQSLEAMRQEHDPSEEVEALRDALRLNDLELADYRKGHGQLSNLFASLQRSVDAISPVREIYIPTARKGKVETPVVAAMQLTDWHNGAQQEPSEIEGFGEFGPEIAKTRVLRLIDGVTNWVETSRHGYNIDKLVIVATGDLMSGDIHEELRVTNAWPSPVQAIKTGELLAESVMSLAPHFKSIEVHFIAADNHSRLTKKPQAKEAGLNSFNYVVGCMAQALLAQQANVTFNLYPLIEKVVNVGGMRYLCTHGNQLKAWMGIPYYGLQRKVGMEAEHRMNMDASLHFDKLLVGHFHTPINTPRYMMGGSLSGTDAYDHAAGRHGRPSQNAWLVHPTHGEFNWTPFWLDVD